MKTDDKQQIGIVIESYNHDDFHRVVTVRFQKSESYLFIYTSEIPTVEFGDTVLMNCGTNGKLLLRRGNSRLTFKITPLVFPGTLLMELISERLNQ